MKQLVEGFSKQLQEAISIGENARLTPASAPIRQVVITGLGGSGIGGTIVSEVTAMDATVPVLVSKTYFLPSFVDENTLVIVSSYSGNTEETLQAMEVAIQKKAKIACVTSGGKIAEIAKKNGIDLVLIPGGMPPRACLGYSFTQLFFILGFHGILASAYQEHLKAAVALLNNEKQGLMTEAASLAKKLNGKIPVIYCTTYYEGVAIRFRQQINENSKMLCWHHVFPEMNHNELVGWTEKHDNMEVVLLRDHDEYERNKVRFEICKTVISRYSSITEIYTKGKSAIEKSLYLVHLCDWVSCYLADANGVDAVEVNVINYLKGELSKI